MKNLKNPPIIEALVQINYDTGSPVSNEMLQAFVKPFGDEGLEAINQVQIQPNKDPSVSIFGYKVTDSSRNEVVQLTKEFIAFSALSKYTGWEDFNKSALEKINNLLGVAPVKNINRIAIRYVNRIEIPDSFQNKNKYLKFSSDINEELSVRMQAGLVQATLDFDDYGAKANVISRIEKVAPNKFINFLDIDVFENGYYKPTLEAIEVELTKLRDVKNLIFKNCFQETLIENFNK